MNMSGQLWPRQYTPSNRVTLATSSVAPVSQRANWSSCRISGVTLSPTSSSIALMRPSSVSRPVAITSPRAWP
ncbi:hypothetical protein D3C78_1919920 [compost metagenome]